jgi:hypothetical protein
MAKKTFKIGEYAKGGVISIETSKTRVTIIGKEWDFSTGSSRGSNQSNAKEFTRIEVDISEDQAERNLENFLLDLTTYYYTDKMIEWIKKSVTFKGY